LSVPAVATAAHRARDAVFREHVCEVLAGVLAAPVAVEDESGLLPRVLQTVIAWGRHGEVFEYDYTTGMIGLPTVDEGEKTAAS
jgi:hypothetical protein